MTDKRILVTGATGKVGQTFIDRLLASADHDGYAIRALCHNRMLEPTGDTKDQRPEEERDA
jgi:UDP-glucose 4-epimerase